MFSAYRKALDEADNQEARITAEYEIKREALTLKIQEKMKKETSRISKKLHHNKDYNPVAFANSITKMKHQHDEIVSEEKDALGVVKTTLDNDLSRVSDWVPPVTELYKIISCSDEPIHSCWVLLVWFTLVPIPEFDCVPGDPIRVEWRNTNNKRKYKQYIETRTSSKLKGLKIPMFSGPGQCTMAGQFYDYVKLKNEQKKWWREWIEENRPIPK